MTEAGTGADRHRRGSREGDPVTTAPCMVIGVGRLDRGDDAAGILAARACAEVLPREVQIAESGGDPSHLLELWRGVKTVVLLDAASTGSRPGAVHRFDASKEPLPARFRHHSTHGFGVAEAIELGRSLRQLPPRVIVIAIEGKQYEAGASLSPELQAALREACAAVQRVCSEEEDAPA